MTVLCVASEKALAGRPNTCTDPAPYFPISPNPPLFSSFPLCVLSILGQVSAIRHLMIDKDEAAAGGVHPCGSIWTVMGKTSTSR